MNLLYFGYLLLSIYSVQCVAPASDVHNGNKLRKQSKNWTLQCLECDNRRECVHPRNVNCSFERAERTYRTINKLVVLDGKLFAHRNLTGYKCIELDYLKRGKINGIIKGCYYLENQYASLRRVSVFTFCSVCFDNYCNKMDLFRYGLIRGLSAFVHQLMSGNERKLFERKPRAEQPQVNGSITQQTTIKEKYMDCF